MEKRFRVFLCSTFADLRDERKAVLDAIRKLQLEHDSMEFFGARSNLSITTCLEEVRRSDIVVVIVGHRYGNLVPRRNISFSEAEYREGHKLKRPCLVYFIDENSPVLIGNVERDPDKMQLLDRWKKTLSKRHTVSTFTNAHDLAVRVAVDLSRIIKNINESGKAVAQASREDVSAAVARTGRLNQAMTDLERSYDITLEAMGDALDLRNAEPEGHSKRVTAFTIAIARGMGITGERIRIMARGAFLHDIGKISIPDSVLRKIGPYAEAEKAAMREHCIRGYQVVHRIPFLAEAAEIIYAHHERYDGTGYPRGLRGTDIPLGARIFSVADTLDAIITDQPHRARKTIAEARQEVLQGSGTQFDPEVVRVFMEMPDNIWEDLRNEIEKQSYAHMN